MFSRCIVPSSLFGSLGLDKSCGRKPQPCPLSLLGGAFLQNRRPFYLQVFPPGSRGGSCVGQGQGTLGAIPRRILAQHDASPIRIFIHSPLFASEVVPYRQRLDQLWLLVSRTIHSCHKAPSVRVGQKKNARVRATGPICPINNPKRHEKSPKVKIDTHRAALKKRTAWLAIYRPKVTCIHLQQGRAGHTLHN